MYTRQCFNSMSVITESLLKEVYTHVVQASKTYNLRCPLAQTQTQLTHHHKLHCLGVPVVDFEEPVNKLEHCLILGTLSKQINKHVWKKVS